MQSGKKNLQKTVLVPDCMTHFGSKKNRKSIMNLLDELKCKILEGYEVTRQEMMHVAQHCSSDADLKMLCDTAHEITQKMAPLDFDMCSIINAKSGKCSEDCKWCAQSIHYPTKTDVYGLVGQDTMLEHAVYNENKGVKRFSLVTSGKKPGNREIQSICEAVSHLKTHSRIRICTSLGLADEQQLQQLYAAGVERYHCNLETAPSYFGDLCTTHTQEQKLQTLKAAKKAGMEICCGGIIGMGESEEQRIELAFKLRELEVESIPLNILHPIPGTPLEHTPLLEDRDILRTIAFYRMVHPRAYLRLAGGRARLSEEMMQQVLYTGINAAIVGDLLTTLGSCIDEDKKRFLQAGYRLA